MRRRPTLDRGDDLLTRYLPAERPAAFDSLLPAERAWRGRLFLMTWAYTRSAAYAWAMAGSDDPHQIEISQELMARVPDGRIEAALRLTRGERRGAMFFELGD